jgi:hypothetical protein
MTLSRHHLLSQTPLPRLNWALPLLGTAVMVDVADPIVGKSVRQLDGWPVRLRRESYSRHRCVDLASLLLGWCEDELTAPFDNSSSLSIPLSYNALFRKDYHSVLPFQLTHAIPLACQHVSVGLIN